MNSHTAAWLAEIAGVGARVGLAVDTAVVDDRGGWIEVTKLLSDGDATITHFVDRVASDSGAASRRVAAMVAWKQYTYICAQLSVGSWASYACVPDLTRDNTAIRFDSETGYPQLAMIEPRVYVGEDDPRADLEIARVVAADGLSDVLHDIWWSGHFAPAVDRWRNEARLAERGLVAFAVSQATVIVSRSIDGSCAQRHEAIDSWRGSLPESMRPMVKTVEWQTGDGWMPLPLRTSCCLQYEIDPPASYCTTCNLLSDDERTRQMVASGTSWRPVQRPERAAGGSSMLPS